MICSICGERRKNAELLGFHLMWDHGIMQMANCLSGALEVTPESLHPR
ncbi:hypothetical protein LCGC14_1816840 [marine sediment metagenome]|uniref:C2H2-type domain-containing protein n=1 Tax=marine sediment metagenome TaxID=412755 RepID=A0A0F9JJN8_9ZZZZ